MERNEWIVNYLKGKEVTIEGITSQGNYVFEESYFYYSKHMEWEGC